jgi:chorismate mutase
MIALEEPMDRAREDIEAVDRELVLLIARRVQLARTIGRAKRARGMPTMDPAREAAVVRRAGELARAAGLDEEVVRQIFWQLVSLARDAQDAPQPPAASSSA